MKRSLTDHRHTNTLFAGARLLLIIIFSAGGGVFLTLYVALNYYSELRPDLNTWHQVNLSQEYGPAKYHEVTQFEQYLELENRLFDELENQIYQQLPANELSLINRFSKSSPVDPTHYVTNWNRSQILPSSHPIANCLLVHGLTDSPYSLHSLATTLQAQGCYVVSLRLPGHGTSPSGLLTVKYQDWQQAIRLAIDFLFRQDASIPLYFVGYSTGASLGIDYVLSKLEGEKAHDLAGIVMLSPAIGLPEVARFASWQRMISSLPGLEELAWNSLLPEFDPYKFNSFAINAAEQVQLLTAKNKKQLQEQFEKNNLQRFPPTLAYMSAFDSTVSTAAVINDFFMRLPPNHHRLIVYDINRKKYSNLLFKSDVMDTTQKLLGSTLPFQFTLLSNFRTHTNQIEIFDNITPDNADNSIDLYWDDAMYSLSHSAIPFPASDPVYGRGKFKDTTFNALGNITLRGERGLLRIPENMLLRLRYNPFYAYQESTIIEFLQLETPHDPASSPAKEQR